MSTPHGNDSATLYDYIAGHAAETPNREALVSGPERVSYSELIHRVDACTRSIVACGVKPGDRVALLEHPGVHFAVILLSCARAGAIFVALDPGAAKEQLQQRIADTEPTLLFSLTLDAWGHNHREALEDIIQPDDPLQTVSTDQASSGNWQGWDQFLQQSEGHQAQLCDQKERPLTIVYTSGSTGKPKGALLSQENLISAMHCFRAAYADRPQLLDNLRFYSPIPITSNGAQSDVLCTPLMLGGTVIFDKTFDMVRTLDMIEQEKITIFYATPMLHDLRLEHPLYAERDASSIHSLCWAGATANPVLVKKMRDTGAYIWGNYGITEGGTIITAIQPTETDMQLNNIGKIPDIYQYRIVDNQGNNISPPACGELLLKGSGVFKGYWKNPEKTAMVLSEDGWFRTEDIVSQNADGTLSYMSRKKDVYQVGGTDIYPVEIENALIQHPSINQVAVINLNNDSTDQRLDFAYIVATDEPPFDDKALRAFCAEQLGPHKTPGHFVAIDRLPLLPTGKTDKKTLEEWTVDRFSIPTAAKIS